VSVAVFEPGDRVFITDQSHPWVGRAGELVIYEAYGLGWTGWRIKLDENCGETYASPDQFMGPGRVDSIRMFGRRKRGGRVGGPDLSRSD
jgi:hypothetical protein